jgi:hypothetical protein
MFPKLKRKEFGFLLLGFSFLLLFYLPSSFEFFYYLAVVYNYNIAFICIGIILTLLSEEAIFDSKIRFVIIVLLLIFAIGINEISSLIIVFFAFVLITLSLLKRTFNRLDIIRLAIISIVIIWLWLPKKVNYSNIIYCRPDLEYITPFNICWLYGGANVIYTPNFHRRPPASTRASKEKSINDRFAIGTPKSMKYYGNRFFEALIYSKSHVLDSRIFLEDTLKRHNIKMDFINFLFIRVRATGKKDKGNVKLTRKLSAQNEKPSSDIC